jgi:hypothetical protein
MRLMMEAVARGRGRGVVDRWDIITQLDDYIKTGRITCDTRSDTAQGPRDHSTSSPHHGAAATASALRCPLVLISESGMGKTSSLVNWMRCYRASHPGHRIIYHAMMPSPQCSGTLSIIMRLAMDLSPWIDEASVCDAQSVKALFTTALLWANESASHSGCLVVIVLDAVNHTHDLSWVPTFLPPAIRLIVSATSKSSFDAKADVKSAESKKTMAKEGVS